MPLALDPNQPHRAIQQSSWVASLSSTQRVSVSAIVALFVFFGGGALDWLVRRQFLPPISLMLAGAAVAVVIGASVLKILTDAHAHYTAVLDRLQLIADLNHHIRNALQVIKFLGMQNRSSLDAVQLQLVNDSVDRIEWALREVLPRYPIGAINTPMQDPQVGAIGPIS